MRYTNSALIAVTPTITASYIHENDPRIRGPIQKISEDNLTITTKLRSTYDGRLI